MKRPEVSLLIQSHNEFSSSSGFGLLEAKWGKIFVSTLFPAPIFNGSFGVQRQCTPSKRLFYKSPGLCHIPGGRRKGYIAQELGKTGKILYGLGKVLNSPVLLLSTFSPSASGSVMKIKPINAPRGAVGPGWSWPDAGMQRSGVVDAAQAG